MDRLLSMDKQQYVSQMQAECRQIMEQIADAVNNAPTGNLISDSEMQVRDLMAQLRQKAFQTAVQMRIDSTESSFCPSQGRLETTIELGARAGGETGTTCCQRIAPLGATSNTLSLASHVMPGPRSLPRLLPWL